MAYHHMNFYNLSCTSNVYLCQKWYYCTTFSINDDRMCRYFQDGIWSVHLPPVHSFVCPSPNLWRFGIFSGLSQAWHPLARIPCPAGSPLEHLPFVNPGCCDTFRVLKNNGEETKTHFDTSHFRKRQSIKCNTMTRTIYAWDLGCEISVLWSVMCAPHRINI